MQFSMLQAIGFFLFVYINVLHVVGRGTRNPSAVPDHLYDVLIEMIRGTYDVPVKKRSLLHLAASRRFYRYRDRYSLSEDNPTVILLDGKALLRQSEVDRIVYRQVNRTKREGALTIHNRIKQRYAGSSKSTVLKVLSRNPRNTNPSIEFTNRATSIPAPRAYTALPAPTAVHRPEPRSAPSIVPSVAPSVVPNRVMEQLRIDVLHMESCPEPANRNGFQYILSVIDLFSCYTWLFALESNTSKAISRKLAKLFLLCGYPKAVQNGCGSEFNGEVKDLLCSKNIKQIANATYIDKIERKYRSLKNMIAHSIEKSKSTWKKSIHLYASSLNNSPSDDLDNFTPFEAFFGRPYTLADSDTNKTHRRSSEAPERSDNILIEHQKNQPPILESVNIKAEAKEIIERRSAIEDATVDGDLILHDRQCMGETALSRQWADMKDLQQQEQTYQSRDAVKAHIDSSAKLTSTFGLPIIYDPEGDGQCMFSTISDQLSRYHNTSVSSTELRLRAVLYLYQHDYLGSQAVDPWCRFLMNENPIAYLSRMLRSEEYGDHLMLQSLSQDLNMQILVVSTINDGAHLISPDGSGVYRNGFPLIVMGHFAEGCGEHYVSLQHHPPTIADIISGSSQILLEHDTDDNMPSITVKIEIESPISGKAIAS